MQVQYKKQPKIKVDSWVNERQITDAGWEVFVDANRDDVVFILLKDSTGQNQVRINITKETPFEPVI
jgi:aspartyl-tRNA synthetase